MTDFKTGELYMATSPSGKRYVGITTRGVERRWRDHVKEARRGTRSRLNSAIKKYGGDAFQLEILDHGSWDKLNEMEAETIARLGTLWPDGYNLRAGGSQFAPHPESIAKQAEKLRGRKWSEERKAQHRQAMNRPEVKAACSAPHAGRKATAETRRKMSESRRGRAPSPQTIEAARSANLGAKRSEEARQRMRDATRPSATDEARQRMSESATQAWKKRRAV
jgi:group I intron endonuclease